ncbi:MAG: hypothetical protein QME79_09755 [Bacillota bacterium]|nr:hypothetical protein [Bacillota bacterium]
MRLPTVRWPRPWQLLSRLARRAEDRVAVHLPGLELAVERLNVLPVPAELTVVVPRAEFRGRLTAADGGQGSFEVILSSITVVHSPRHAPERGPGTPPIRESGPAGT